MSMIDRIPTLENFLEERLQALANEDRGIPAEQQLHLDIGTSEREYWHHGYASALKDILHMLRGSGRLVN
jgi:hypothetical protein